MARGLLVSIFLVILASSLVQVARPGSTRFIHSALPPGPTALSSSRWREYLPLQRMVAKYIEYHNSETQRGLKDSKVLLLLVSQAGLGNRITPMISAIVLGMITNRVVLFDYPAFDELFESPLDLDVRPHVSSLGNATRIIYPSDSNYFAGSDLQTTHAEDRYLALIDDDYFLALLMMNPFHEAWFNTYFPHGEVFHAVSRMFLFPHPSVSEAAAAFADANFGTYTVGLQIRAGKNLGKSALPKIDTFVSLARALIQMASPHADAPVVYVAADMAVTYAAVRDALPGVKVVWNTDNGIGTSSKTLVGNPGTEQSAYVDMLLLAYCDDMVVTIGSSYGQTAAGLSGARPFHLTTGTHEHRTNNPWFWRALSSEPCSYRTGEWMKHPNSTITDLWQKSLFGRQHAQCHW